MRLAQIKLLNDKTDEDDEDNDNTKNNITLLNQLFSSSSSELDLSTIEIDVFRFET